MAVEKIGDNFEAELESVAAAYALAKKRVEVRDADPVNVSLDKALKANSDTLHKLLEVGFEPDQELVITGELLDGKKTSTFEVVVPAVPASRTLVDIKAVYEIMGDAFWDIATVPLGLLDAYLTPEQAAKVVTTERKGKRKLKSSVT